MTTRPTERRRARRRPSVGAPRPDAEQATSPLEGTTGIARSAAGDLARFATAPARALARVVTPAVALPARGAIGAARAAGWLAQDALRRLRGDDDEQTGGDAERRTPERRAPERPSPARTERGPGPVPVAEAPPPPQQHVSEEAVLVAEFAERGAEDGPGPQLTVEEPWNGYDRLSAAELVRRLDGADAAVAGAVQLYEGTRRRRKSVLAAAERALREDSPPGI